MNNRLQALFRLILILPAYLVMIVIGPIVFLVGALVFLIDILLQAVTGGEGLTPGSGNILTTILDWYRAGFRYILYGET